MCHSSIRASTDACTRLTCTSPKPSSQMGLSSASSTEERGDREYTVQSCQPSRILTALIRVLYSEDKSDHAGLARRLAEGTSSAVAVPNYRLTTPKYPLRHPGHTEDLLAFLHFIREWAGPSPQGPLPYDPSRLYLIGHSCSAHMLTSILLSPAPTSKVFPSLTPSGSLLRAVKGVIMSEGIYDVDLLLKSFPAYREWFIADAFEDLDSYVDVNTAAYKMREGGKGIRWLVLHSKGDTLVDEVQSQTMVAHLKTFESTAHESGDAGHVESYFDLTQEHNDALLEDRYHEVVSGFIARTEELNSKA